MLPLKISSFLERAPLPQSRLGPARARPAAADAPVVAPAEAARPEHDRRVTATRRGQDRRESEQPAFLDTRIAQGRRRSSGRRAEDQLVPALRKAISVKA